MAKRLFKADLDEVELHRKRLQEALTVVDKASAEAISTRVVNDLKVAHADICLAITFLTTPEQITTPRMICDGAANGSPDFLSRGGSSNGQPLFSGKRRNCLSD